MSSVSPLRCRLVGLSLLASAGIFAAPAAHAQGLALGSGPASGPGAATISGSGTSASGVYAFSSGASAATKAYSTVSAYNYVGNLSSVTLNAGGSIQTLSVYASTLSMTGGSIGSLSLGTYPTGSTGALAGSSATITGGSVSTISATGGVSIFFDGNITEYTTCNLSGGTFGTLNASNYGGYDVFGTNLSLSNTGLVTGTLSSGQAINAQYVNTDGKGFIDFVNTPAAVPEASTTVSLGLLLTLGLGGMIVAKRRKTTA